MGEINKELEINEVEQCLESQLQEDTLTEVLFLGPKSKNGRIYTKEAMKDALSLYENQMVYVDHSDKERKLSDRFGTTEGVKLTEKGIVGSIKCLKSHPLFETIRESYDKKTPRIGCSHNAMGQGSTNNGITTINKITAVKSIDLVTGSASTQNLRESEGSGEADKDKLQLLEQEMTSMKELVTSLQGEIKSLTESNKALVEKSNKWQIPTSAALTENVKSDKGIPKDSKALGKWLCE